MSRFFLVLLCLALSTSCMKKLSDTDEDGEPVSSLEIQNAVFKAWGPSNFTDIRLGEFAAFDREQSIHSQPPVLIQQEGTSVTLRDNTSDPSVITYKFVIQTKEINGDNVKDSKSERTETVPNTELAVSSLRKLQIQRLLNLNAEGDSIQAYALSIEYMLNYASLCQKGTDWDVTCYNLVTTHEVRPAPEAVRKQVNCGGVANCQLNVTKVDFDLILTSAEDDNTVSRQKAHYTLSFSSDVPYLSRLIGKCSRLLVMVPSMGQKILVDTCDKVVNFQFGKN